MRKENSIIILLLFLYGCGNARSDDIHAQAFTAPDGTQCYAIIQNGEVKGGNCK